MTNTGSFKSVIFFLLLLMVFLLAVWGIVREIIIHVTGTGLDILSFSADLLLLVVVVFLMVLAYEFYLIRRDTGLNYQKIFNGSPYAIYIMEKKTYNFIAVNESMTKLYGFTEAEFLNMSALDIRPESERMRIKEFLDNHDELTHESGIWLHRKKNGDCFYVQITFHSVPVFDKDAYLVMVTDVNKAINYEKEISDLLHLYETVNKATNDVIWDYDMVKDQLNWMPGYKETFGYEVEDRPISFWGMLKIHEEDRNEVLSSFQKVVQNKEHSWLAEYRYICADGSIKHISDRGYVIFNAEGEPIRMIGAMHDVTNHKNYEQQLVRQNERLKEIAWTNSHQVRRPLSNILGLVDLITDTNSGNKDLDHLIHLLTNSSKELDNALTTINQQAKESKVDFLSQ